MRAPLVFQAASDGKVFGILEVRNGQAVAWAADLELTRVLLGHAMLWLRRQNPRPGSEVEFRLILQ